MQLPLDFQKFFVKNIQKIKNGLRPSSPCFARSFPPQGEALTKARITLFAEENFASKILCRQEGKARSGWQFCEFFRNKNEQGQGLKKKGKFKLTSLGALRHSTCRACLKTAIRQGLPKGKARMQCFRADLLAELAWRQFGKDSRRAVIFYLRCGHN